MKQIKFLLIGIGILLFCICFYLFGMISSAKAYIGVAYYLQYVGLGLLFLGAFYKNKEE